MQDRSVLLVVGTDFAIIITDIVQLHFNGSTSKRIRRLHVRYAIQARKVFVSKVRSQLNKCPPAIVVPGSPGATAAAPTPLPATDDPVASIAASKGPTSGPATAPTTATAPSCPVPMTTTPVTLSPPRVPPTRALLIRRLRCGSTVAPPSPSFLPRARDR